MACDCPIFAKAKFIQWTWPAMYGEDVFLVMFGGLHLEMGMWNMLGNYLACSGWTTALTDAGIATSGTVDSFLKSSHLTRMLHFRFRFRKFLHLMSGGELMMLSVDGCPIQEAAQNM